MKLTGLLLVATLLFFSCNQNPSSKQAVSSVADVDKPVISFENEIHNFGTVVEGEKVEYAFIFTNTGKTPLIIEGANATCGCTVPEVPNEPIQPGAKGSIRVIFNSLGRPGLNDKVITITSNALTKETLLHLVGEVKTKN